MLEAKAKDQEHKAQVLSKKKKKQVFTKIFQAISKKKKKKKKKRSSQKFFKQSPRKNHPISFGSRLLNAKKYVNPSAFKCRKRVHVRTLRYIGLAFNVEKVQITRKKKKLVFHWPL